jgi:hypothetical protein
VRDYDRTLPKLTVRGSELNQVWTNLLDNAIDALGEQGTITITHAPRRRLRARRHRRRRPRHPARVRDRVFDPFFTTKDVGQGTGLGLDTARRIVVDRHDGSLTVDSGPARTTFHVWLPFEGGPMTTCTHLDHVRSPSCPRPSTAARTACDRRRVAAPAHLPGVRPRRLLRRLAQPPRHRARARHEHPIIRSLEPGEDWSWCFVDEVGMRIPDTR